MENDPVNLLDPYGLAASDKKAAEGNYLYLYSPDIMGKGQSWEMSFKTAAYAEAVRDGVINYDPTTGNWTSKEGYNVGIEEIITNADFKKQMEDFYNEHGKITQVTIASHMDKDRISLKHGSTEREYKIMESDLKGINADVDHFNLRGCYAAYGGAEADNIANSFAEVFGSTVTASTTAAGAGSIDDIVWLIENKKRYANPDEIAAGRRVTVGLMVLGGNYITINPSPQPPLKSDPRSEPLEGLPFKPLKLGR